VPGEPMKPAYLGEVASAEWDSLTGILRQEQRLYVSDGKQVESAANLYAAAVRWQQLSDVSPLKNRDWPCGRVPRSGTAGVGYIPEGDSGARADANVKVSSGYAAKGSIRRNEPAGAAHGAGRNQARQVRREGAMGSSGRKIRKPRSALIFLATGWGLDEIAG
jgi:hypothetical protein